MRPCNSANYSRGRSGPVTFLVIHYTANNGDSAANNCAYFANNKVGASAHYFVDEKGWEQSVSDADTAWHCGAAQYVHKLCRNANAIGVELCSRKDAVGRYYFLPETVRNAQKLVRTLMTKYAVDAAHVLRHYDVTGKVCPAPFVSDAAAWQAFLTGLKVAEKAEPKNKSVSVWAVDAALWAVQKKLLQGDETGNYRWKEPVTREELAVILKRMSELKI